MTVRFIAYKTQTKIQQFFVIGCIFVVKKQFGCSFLVIADNSGKCASCQNNQNVSLEEACGDEGGDK